MDKTFEAVFTIDGETDAAIRLIADNGNKGWVPLSQVHEIHRDQGRHSARVVMTEWIARKKGFIDG